MYCEDEAKRVVVRREERGRGRRRGKEERDDATNPHPRQSLVPRFLHDLEVADLDSGDGEVGDLELDGDGYADGGFVWRKGRGKNEQRGSANACKTGRVKGPRRGE